MALPEHLEKTDFGEEMLSLELDSNEPLLISLGSSAGEANAVVCSAEADFLGEAKRLSGRMCSILLFQTKQKKKINKISHSGTREVKKNLLG